MSRKSLLIVFPQFSLYQCSPLIGCRKKKSAKMLQQHLHRVDDTGIEPEPAVRHADALLSESLRVLVTEVLDDLLH